MDTEQIEKMIALQRKTLRQTRIAAMAFSGLLAVTVAAFAFALPKLFALMAHADAVLAEAEALAVNAGGFMEDTRPLIQEANGLISNANGVILDNTEAVAAAVAKLNDIDIARLNDAIDGLASAVQPLARLGEILSR